MRRPLLPIAALWLVVSPLIAQLPQLEPSRKWTLETGAAFDAAVAGFDGTNVTFRMPNGSRAQAPAAKLSSADRDFLAAWQKRQPIKVALPDSVSVDAAQMKAETVSEDPVAAKFIYRTPHFEFESQGKFNQTLLREVARSFEATYELVKALPWGIVPQPESGTHFRARLLKDRAAYHSAGGPLNSGGVYMRREEIFMVPFENIGVKTVGKSYAKTDDFETRTLVHELTHQMMHTWLNLLPPWMIEGTAEYTGNLPLRAGTFRVSSAKTGMKDYLDFLKKRTVDGVPEPYPLEELFGVTHEKWSSTLAGNPGISHRLYFTSYLLVYYFMHLDGKGDAQNFVRALREVGEVQGKIEKYRQDIEAFKKLPGVETLPDGGLRWRGDLKPPEAPAVLKSQEARDELQKQVMKVLLASRSEADLMKQIRSAYARLGVRL